MKTVYSVYQYRTTEGTEVDVQSVVDCRVEGFVTFLGKGAVQAAIDNAANQANGEAFQVNV